MGAAAKAWPVLVSLTSAHEQGSQTDTRLSGWRHWTKVPEPRFNPRWPHSRTKVLIHTAQLVVKTEREGCGQGHDWGLSPNSEVYKNGILPTAD